MSTDLQKAERNYLDAQDRVWRMIDFRIEAEQRLAKAKEDLGRAMVTLQEASQAWGVCVHEQKQTEANTPPVEHRVKSAG